MYFLLLLCICTLPMADIEMTSTLVRIICERLVSSLDGTTEFLKHLGDLYRNFGVHPIPVVSMDRNNIVKMREWAREHGQ